MGEYYASQIIFRFGMGVRPMFGTVPIPKVGVKLSAHQPIFCMPLLNIKLYLLAVSSTDSHNCLRSMSIKCVQ